MCSTCGMAGNQEECQGSAFMGSDSSSVDHATSRHNTYCVCVIRLAIRAPLPDENKINAL